MTKQRMGYIIAWITTPFLIAGIVLKIAQLPPERAAPVVLGFIATVAFCVFLCRPSRW